MVNSEYTSSKSLEINSIHRVSLKDRDLLVLLIFQHPYTNAFVYSLG